MTKNGQTTEVLYTYDGDDVRASRTVTSESVKKTTNYLTAGGVVLAQSGDGTAKYVRGMGYVAKIGVSNDVHYYQYNGHGDVAQVVSSSGSVENYYDYDAFGETILAVEDVENEIRYSGEFYDEAAGLYYLRARYYDPVTARFTQEDTYRGNAADVASLNLYVYCYNDPMHDFVTGEVFLTPPTGPVSGVNRAHMGNYGVTEKYRISIYNSSEQDKLFSYRMEAQGFYIYKVNVAYDGIRQTGENYDKQLFRYVYMDQYDKNEELLDEPVTTYEYIDIPLPAGQTTMIELDVTMTTGCNMTLHNSLVINRDTSVERFGDI